MIFMKMGQRGVQTISNTQLYDVLAEKEEECVMKPLGHMAFVFEKSHSNSVNWCQSEHYLLSEKEDFIFHILYRFCACKT